MYVCIETLNTHHWIMLNLFSVPNAAMNDKKDQANINYSWTNMLFGPVPKGALRWSVKEKMLLVSMTKIYNRKF